MQHIKAIIADVDGVMVGGKEGVNFPLPHTDVMRALRDVSAHGTPIVLCTAKLGHAVKDIALQAKLDNPHIADGGALITNWVKDELITRHQIDPKTVEAYVQACLEKDIYVELYTADGYCLQESQIDEFTKKRSKVVRMEPKAASSLLKVARKEPILKMISFSRGNDDMPDLEQTVQRFSDKISYIWSQHPFLAPRRPLIITARGVSKQNASLEVAQYLNISPEDILGIGDSESDWSFMQLCGYAATVGSEAGELQNLAKTKGEGHYYFAGSVDDHGLLEIFKHFGISYS
jgi:HAD superfamily hydrolase (TIGR01484 family)